jgi:hypothetical protein
MVRNNENFKKVWKETAMVSFAEGERGRYKSRQTSSIKAVFDLDSKQIHPE